MIEVEQHFHELETESPDAFLLARVVSFAVRADPALIRAARLDLLTDVDVGAEGDLWFSTAVDLRSVEGIVLHAEVAELLRRHLAQSDPGLYERAWELTRRVHDHLSPAIQLEEEVSYLIHSGKPGAQDQARRRFLSAVAAMVAEEGGGGLAHWAARALPRFPPSVRDLEEARMLSAGANLRLDDALSERESIDGDRARDWIGLVTPRSVKRREVGLRLWPGMLEVVDSAEVPPEQRIALPETDPLVLEIGVSWEEDEGLSAQEIEERFDEVAMLALSTGPDEMRKVCGGLAESLQLPRELEDATVNAVDYQTLRFRSGETPRVRIHDEVRRLRTVLGDEFRVESSPLFPMASVRRALESLRDYLHFESMRDLAGTLVEVGQGPPFVRRLLAQSLIDLGDAPQALRILQELLSATEEDIPEQIRVRQTIARIYGMVFLRAERRDEIARTAFERAVRLHLDLRELGGAGPAERGRQSVAAAGLLRRAGRDGWMLEDVPPYQQLAEEAIEQMPASLTERVPVPRQLVTLVEAHLALDEREQALGQAEQLLRSVDSFETPEAVRAASLTPYELVSLLRRIRHVWEAA